LVWEQTKPPPVVNPAAPQRRTVTAKGHQAPGNRPRATAPGAPLYRDCLPVRLSCFWRACQFGQANAPMIPHDVQTIGGPKAGTGTTSPMPSTPEMVLQRRNRVRGRLPTFAMILLSSLKRWDGQTRKARNTIYPWFFTGRLTSHPRKRPEPATTEKPRRTCSSRGSAHGATGSRRTRQNKPIRRR
jgi:hypothetical protein